MTSTAVSVFFAMLRPPLPPELQGEIRSVYSNKINNLFILIMPTTKKKIEKAKNLCVIDQIVIKRISKSAWARKNGCFYDSFTWKLNNLHNLRPLCILSFLSLSHTAEEINMSEYYILSVRLHSKKLKGSYELVLWKTTSHGFSTFLLFTFVKFWWFY